MAAQIHKIGGGGTMLTTQGGKAVRGQRSGERHSVRQIIQEQKSNSRFLGTA